jgi:cytochrome c peroxidase
MNKNLVISSAVALTIFSGCFGGGNSECDCEEKQPQNIEKEAKVVEKTSEPLMEKAEANGLKPLPESKEEVLALVENPNNKFNDAKIELGKKLYFEPRISKSNLISCNTCHNLATGGVDGVSAAIGHGWTANPHHLNSPTVYNAVFAEKQFWDGRDPDLEKQAQGPILAGPEMASTKEIVVDTIKSMPEYVAEFESAFGTTEVTYEKATAAIGAFERTLVTRTRLDDYLSGDATALTGEEKKGLKVFIDKGCISCHTGYALGGTMQQFPAIGKFKYANLGDFGGDVNGRIKTPTLRNILETAPYFHNGATFDIAETVKIMGEIQLGTQLSDEEVSSIVTFFGALEGEKPEITYPVLPASTATTPKPDVK